MAPFCSATPFTASSVEAGGDHYLPNASPVHSSGTVRESNCIVFGPAFAILGENTGSMTDADHHR